MEDFWHCNYTAKSLAEIIKHQKEPHMLSKECIHCGAEFIRNLELNKHLKEEHDIKRNSKNTTGE
jgi:hypothetical protein